MRVVICSMVSAVAAILAFSISAEAGYDKFNVAGYWADKAGRKEEAIQLWLQSIQYNESRGDKSSVALNCDNVAQTYRELKNYNQAIAYYRKAAQAWLDVGKQWESANSQFQIARCCYDAKSYQNAEQFFQRALAIYQTASKWQKETLNSKDWIAWSQWQLKKYAEADRTITESLAERSQSGSSSKEKRLALANGYKLQGMCHVMLQNPDFAEVLKKALDIYEKEKDQNSSLGAVYFWLGTGYEISKKYDLAESNYNVAMAAFQKANSTNDIANVTQVIDRVRKKMQMGDSAASDAAQALAAASQVNSAESNGATTPSKTSELDEKVSQLETSLRSAPSAESYGELAVLQLALGNSTATRENADKALQMSLSEEQKQLCIAAMCLAMMKDREIESANTVLARAEKECDHSKWTYPLFAYLKGNQSEAQIDAQPPQQKGVLLSCIGFKKLATGQAEESAKYFSKAAASPSPNDAVSRAWHLAASHLDRQLSGR